MNNPSEDQNFDKNTISNSAGEAAADEQALKNKENGTQPAQPKKDNERRDEQKDIHTVTPDNDNGVAGPGKK